MILFYHDGAVLSVRWIEVFAWGALTFCWQIFEVRGKRRYPVKMII